MTRSDAASETGSPVVVLSGGGGGARLAGALSGEAKGRQVVVVTNTGDDFEHLGLLICPDTDSVLYTLSGKIDQQRGWGRAEESWLVFEELKNIAGPAWFQVGDKDLALHLSRASLLSDGQGLVEATRALAKQLGVPDSVIVVPATESPVRTHVLTDQGRMAFQEYFVGQRCEPVLKDVIYEGVDAASPSQWLVDLLSQRGTREIDVVLGPSNPFLSLGPILDIPGMLSLLRQQARRVVAVSPIIGGRALKGPAAKIMSELGLPVSAAGWTLWMSERYPDLVDTWVWDEADEGLASSGALNSFDIRTTSTVMPDPAIARQFGAWLLEACASEC
ncbi:MAG: 2-phospho-L-lactate transferase [Halieaceae bacterium]|nr:MAG: 2-phospho-L-lactate transferase [Halieaceae bacterium]